MSTRMKRLTFSVLLCLLGYTLISYGMSDTKPVKKYTEQQNAAHELMCQETFRKLRETFPNPILDEDFETLKQVTSTKVYLDFLKQAYPTEKPFDTLNKFIGAVPPSTERYQDFLNKHFDNLTEADFQNVRLLTLSYRRTDIMMVHANETKDQKSMQAALTERILIIRKEPIRTWWKSRVSGKSQAEKMALILGLDKFATETQKVDTDWIQAQFETHGQEDAMLWIALRKPVLIGEILANFNSPNAFLTWVKQSSILEKLSELEKL